MVDDIGATDEDTPVTIDLLGNDSDVDGDTLTITDVSVPEEQGTVVDNGDGTVTFTPAENFNGPATITYSVSDGNGGSDSGEATISVGPVNDAPIAVDDVASTEFETPVTIDVLDNDIDPDGDELGLVTATVPAAQGTVVVNEDNSITFTPADGFEGTAIIDYTVSDGNGLTDFGVVEVLVSDEPLDGIVQGTDGDDLIDTTFDQDPQGDRIDNNDEILPGEGPNDDIVLAGDGDDTVLAGDGDDDVDGGEGEDEIFGEDGDDTLDGGADDDLIDGGAGDDTITDLDGNNEVVGGTGSDTVTTGDGDDFIDTAAPLDDDPAPLPDRGFPGVFDADEDPDNDKDVVDAGDGDNIVFTGDDDDIITTGDGNDFVDAGFDDDVINTGAGDDEIIGGEGSDDIQAGDGDDIVYGGLAPIFPDALNIPDEDGDPVPDNGMDVIDGGAGDDQLFGQDDDDILIGGSGDDLLDGGVDDDDLDGGTGDDTLIGGQGADVMAGGDDRDTFIVDAPEDGFGDEIDGGDGGDDFDTLDLRGSGPLRVTFTSPDNEDGFVEFLDDEGDVSGRLDFVEIESVIPCFTPGTMIATPKGERAVETLEIGDRIITRDNGIQEIRWIGNTTLPGDRLIRAEHLRPVLIRQGALGNDLPERDMLVSPNHRVLVANDKTALYFEESEVLVAAKHLTGMEGIDVVDVSEVTYIHFMFDQHEVILSDGAWTESFQPGDQSLAGVGNAQRTEILELFPELKTRSGLEGYPAARRSLKKHEARLLM